MIVSPDFVAAVRKLIKEKHEADRRMLDRQYQKLDTLIDDWARQVELDTSLGVLGFDD